jgi:hypothetical protein
VSILADLLDRLSGISVLRDRVQDLAGQLSELRRMMMDQQRELASVQGQLKALLRIQSQSDRKP